MKKLFAFIAVAFAVIGLKAQNDMTIHSMQIIPQSYYNNPALIPTCKIHVGVPGLSSFYLDGGHTGFVPKNVISTNIYDSVQIDMEGFVNSLAKNNYLFLDLNEEILSFGFKFKEKHYVNFSLTEKAFARISYPKDLIEFVFYGNGAMMDEDVLLGNLNVNAAHYREYAFGYSMDFNEKWNFGARAKLLFGKMNLNTARTDVTFYTESQFYDITVTSDVVANWCIPWELTDTLDDTELDAKEYIMNSQNFGLGFDMGATYKYDDKWTFGLSVIDLGFISWKAEDDVMNFVSKNPGGSFTYDGIDITDFFETGLDSTAQSDLENMADSVIDIFKIDSTYNPYNTMLNTRIYASAFYDLTEKDRFSGLARIHFYDKGIHPSFSLAYQRKFGNILRLTGSYSIAHRNFTNLGVGFALNLGPMQLYMVTDNVLGPIIWNKYMWTEEEENGDLTNESLTLPRNWRYMNFHFGLNVAIGCKPPKDYVPIID
ncbi:MAG: hypothetical protein C0592_14560 [Marinilabiliales bacterium]|nr:MAG: hypothetical protein C0592_14560 [Marinilabiliales bacterium]